MKIGFHVPTDGGIATAVRRAVARRCTTVQVFTSSPVQWELRPLPDEEVSAFRTGMSAAGIAPVFVHGLYLLNLASRDRKLFNRSVSTLAEDLRRADLLGAAGVVIHLGSPARRPQRRDLDRVVRGVDRSLERAEANAVVLLENCAGQGFGIGHDVGHLSHVLEHSRYSDRLRVCWDTAHGFQAGCDLRTPEALEATLAELDAAVCLDRVTLVHANDSKTELGSRVDRHWHIGKGEIGREGFRLIVNHPHLRNKPFIMETPEATLKMDRMNYRALTRLRE